MNQTEGQGMSSLIAMAGLAEAEIYFMLLFIVIVLFAVGALTGFAWLKKSAALAVSACLICVFLALLLQPWAFFVIPTSPDPDEESWLLGLQMLSVIWAIATFAAVFVLFVTIRYKHRLSMNR